jgi:hypothetical protein
MLRFISISLKSIKANKTCFMTAAKKAIVKISNAKQHLRTPWNCHVSQTLKNHHHHHHQSINSSSHSMNISSALRSVFRKVAVVCV